jgi:SAM-dependent methyltransferase
MVAITIAAGLPAATPARFCVGDYTTAGLRDGCADAVMCIDAIQFGDPPLAGVTEARRILVPGGRLVLTTWEPVNPGGPADERLPERSQRMDLGRDLAEAGLEDIEVTVKPDWYAAERALWEAALAADADGDLALVSLQVEGTRSLQTHDLKRRVLATATAPR